MRRTRLFTAIAAAACALAVGVPAASAGWEGQIDFVTLLSQQPKMIDVGPPGPSAGDAMLLDQQIQIVGLTRPDWALRVGAMGRLTGTFVYLGPSVAQANITLKLQAGLIRVTGLLTIGPNGPTRYDLFAHGWGGMLTGSRGPVIVYSNNGDGTTKGADFSIILR